MSLLNLDFSTPGSDPSNPNSFVMTPDQIQRQQMLAQALMNEGNSTAPIRSPWQGVANLAKSAIGAYQENAAERASRLALANAVAGSSNYFDQHGYGSAGDADIPATPGQSTPALQESDARVDAESAAEDKALGNGMPPNPNTAGLVAGLGGAPPAGPINQALATALGSPGPGGTATPDFYSAAAQHESGGRNIQGSEVRLTGIYD